MKIDKHKIKQHLVLPLPVLFNLVKKRLVESVVNKKKKEKDFQTDRRVEKNKAYIVSPFVNIFKLDTSEIKDEVASTLIKNYLSKEFCLLGSGLVKNTIERSVNNLSDFLLKKHIEKTEEIIKQINIINPNYEFIDWQKDFKSGKSFSTKVWYKDQRNVFKDIDIDIKVPWELSRMQHLPQMAVFALKYPKKRKLLIKEFMCHILDFMAFNPYNMGANWNCAMDVGIRSANILLAYDLFKQLDDNALIDNYFINNITNFIYLHGCHIVQNFEYKEGITSNHYLGNIASLAFIGTFLQGISEADEWLLLAIQELSKELPKQFMEDGSNFEGSTSYHKLSGEFFIITTALLQNITEKRRERLSKINKIKGINGPSFSSNNIKYNLNKKQIFSLEYYSALAKMKSFTQANTKPNGNITQIGDNDSGRFIRLTPVGEIINKNLAYKKYKSLSNYSNYINNEELMFIENDINHSAFISYLNGMMHKADSNNLLLEYSFIKQLSSYNKIVEPVTIKYPFTTNNFTEKLTYAKTKEFNFENVDLLSDITIEHFPNFGLVIYKSKKFYLNIRLVGKNNYKRLDGHKHNDILSIELNVNNKDIILDPGTYVYTSNPKERNRFRSTKSHNTIYVEGIEQRDFSFAKKSLFYLEGDINTDIHTLERNCFKASTRYKNVVHLREIIIEKHKIIINDSCNMDFVQHFNHNLFSNGYGKLLNPHYE